MFRYNGRLTYTGGPRDLERVTVDFVIGLFPPRITISIHDEWYDTTHVLVNSRFNFQSRDSFADLLARDSWETEWMDIFNGTLHLVMPAITGVSHQLEVMLFASWWPAFCIVEYQLGSDYCQVATRPRTSLNSRWLRQNGNTTGDGPDSQQPINTRIGQEPPNDDDSPGRHTDPSTSSKMPPLDPPEPESPVDEPDHPIEIEFDRRKFPLKH